MPNPQGSNILVDNITAKVGNYYGISQFYPLYTEVVLTSAQIKVIRATPITIAAAPGTGLIACFRYAQLFSKYGGNNAFTNPQNLSFRYVDGSGVTISGAVTAAGFIDQTVNMTNIAVSVTNPIATQAQSENKAIVIHNVGASEITGNAAGDNTIIVRLCYHVLPTGF